MNLQIWYNIDTSPGLSQYGYYHMIFNLVNDLLFLEALILLPFTLLKKPWITGWGLLLCIIITLDNRIIETQCLFSSLHSRDIQAMSEQCSKQASKARYIIYHPSPTMNHQQEQTTHAWKTNPIHRKNHRTKMTRK